MIRKNSISPLINLTPLLYRKEDLVELSVDMTQLKQVGDLRGSYFYCIPGHKTSLCFRQVTAEEKLKNWIVTRKIHKVPRVKYVK